MLRTDRDREGIGAALRHLHRFSRTASDRLPTLVLAPKQSNFRFQVGAGCVNDFSKTLRFSNIFSQRQMPSIVHHRIVTAAQTSDDISIFPGMILMEQDRNVSGFCQTADQGIEFIHASVIEVDKVGLDHDRRIFEHGGFNDRTSHFEIADVKGGYGKPVFENVLQKQSWFSDKHRLQ